MKPKTLIPKNICHPMFIAVLFTITKMWKQPKCPSIDEWIKQLWDIYAMEYYSAMKMKEILPFATVWVDLGSITLSEISQRKTNAIWFHSYVQSNEETELTWKIGTDSKMQSRMMAKVGDVRGWKDWAKRQRTYGHGQQCADCWGWGGVRGLRGNGKCTMIMYMVMDNNFF